MTHKNHRMIVISQQNYEILRKAGTITDSFNSVISKLIKDAKLDENVAMARGSLAGSTESTATAPKRSWRSPR
jgi:hypothetical protein